MKVLIATSYLYNANWPEFTRNKTGFGIMLNGIVHSISEYTDVQFISFVITPGRGGLITKHNWSNVIKDLQWKDIVKGIKSSFQYSQSIGRRIRSIYYNVNKGFVRKIIKEFQPDIVHIHGIGYRFLPYIEVCEELSVPYIVTLHGLIGWDDSVSAPQRDKEFEKEFLIRADKESIPVTVISTGMKKRIEEYYLYHEANNIYVVCNGTRIPYKEEMVNQSTTEVIDLRKQFHMQPKEKIVVAIGSVYENKNQIQIVRALATGAIHIPCKVFICGMVSPNSLVQQEIDKNGLQDTIHLLGFVPQHLIANILEQADLNIIASKNEGFGLSIIEAYAHGVPTVTFSDLDAVPDLYNPDTMIKVDSREDIALAGAVEEALKRNWDSELIKNYAKQFSLDHMAKEYVKVYENAKKRHIASHFPSFCRD